MTSWQNFFERTLSGDVGILIALVGMVVIVSLIGISKDPGEAVRHFLVYTVQLALIMGALWLGYRLIN